MKPEAPLRPRELALPFALVGLVGGHLTAVFFHVDPLAERAGRGEDVIIGWLLLLLTPLTAAALGASLAGAARGSRTRTVLIVIGATLLAGAVNGAILGMFVGLFWGVIAGSVIGLLASLPFLPVIAAVMAAARAVGRARPGSLVDSADRRGVLRTAAVAITVAVAVAALAWTPSSQHAGPFTSLSRLAVVGGLPLLAALLALDLVAWMRTRSVVALGAALEPALGIAEGRLLDFGVGEGARGLPSAASYRNPELVRPVCLGDPRLARALLARAATISMLALAVAVGGAVIALAAA